MAWAYFDPSALVKRYVVEKGRREVLQLLRRHQVVSSSIVSIEIRSAFRRRVSDGTLDLLRLPEILKRVNADREYWTLVAVAEEVLAAAETLVAAHPLRTLDALHVASAQLFKSRMRASEFIFVSADARQTSAAVTLGLTTKRIAA